MRAAGLRASVSLASACVAGGSLSAAPIFWDGSAGVLTPAVPGPPVVPAFYTGAWGDVDNWSATAAANAATTVPGGGDVIQFASTGVTTAQVITLGQTRSVQGIKSMTGLSTSLRGGGSPQVLMIGGSGIDHRFGAITIGSSTDAAGQGVDVALMGDQTWLSSVQSGSTAAVALAVQNGVSIGAGGNQTLTLDGVNTGSQINGNITDGAGVLSLTKAGSAVSVWTLNGTANSYSGATTVTNGTLVLTNTGTYGTITVGAAGTLRLGPGFNGTQIPLLVNAAAFTPGAILSLNNPTATVTTPLAGDFQLTKMGTNTLTLNAANTYTGKTVIDGGTLIASTLAALPSLHLSGNQVNSGAQITVGAGGATGFTAADLDLLVANTTFAPTSGTGLGIDTTGGDLAWDGGLSGVAVRLLKYGGGTLVLTGENTHTGNTTISGGAMAASSLAYTGVANINLGSTGVAGRFRYTGTGETTTRIFNLSGTTGGGVIEAHGPLVIDSNLNVSGSGLKTLTLTGSAAGSSIRNVGNGANTTGLVKTGGGTWRLAGATTYSGTTTIYGGALIFDHSGAENTAEPTGSGLHIAQSGSLILRGKTAAGGATTDSFSNLQLGNLQYGNPTVILDANGGPGIQLTAEILSSTGSNNQHHALFDLSSSTGNNITVTALANIVADKGLIMDPGGSGNRASYVVHDKDGTYGFASLSGGNTGTLRALPLASHTVLVPGAVTFDTAAASYRLPGGTYTTSGGATYTTVTFDSAAAPVTLDLGPGTASHTFNAAGSVSGRGVLFTGANDVTISGGATAGIVTNGALWIHNYLAPSATLHLASSYGTAQAWIQGGTGHTIYSGTGLGTFLLQNGGVFRVTTAQTLPPLKITSGGVFEIGADLNGAADGDFSLAVSGSGILFYGDAGLSAAGANRVVDFNNGTASQALNWGASSFLSNYDGSDGDYAFKLSSTRADATIEIRNNINLNGRTRTVEVADGSAAVDAVLSGVISGSAAADLKKTGAGTLSLTGANTYLGETHVAQGTLKIGSTTLAAASSLRIDAGATVDVTGTVYVASVILDGVAQGPGPIPAGPFITGGTVVVGGPSTGTPYEQWVTEKALGSGESAPTFDADGDGLPNLIEYAVGTEPKIANGSVLASIPGAPHSIRFTQAAGRTDITFVVEASADLGEPWTAIATSTAGGAFTGTGEVIVATDSGIVTVTDNRTPAPARIFYRLRATK